MNQPEAMIVNQVISMIVQPDCLKVLPRFSKLSSILVKMRFQTNSGTDSKKRIGLNLGRRFLELRISTRNMVKMNFSLPW